MDDDAFLLPAKGEAARLVPPTGTAAFLTIFVAGVMAFLCVFALSLLFSTSRLADRWASELARTATIRISAASDAQEALARQTLEILAQTPGVESARALSDDEQAALLAPWFGPDLPLNTLPVPRLVQITETERGFDADGLRLRLEAEVPGAVLDDHTRWRRPLVAAAERLRVLGWVSVGLIGAALTAMVTLAALAALSANAQVISVLRLMGARDTTVARAFTRRFTLRAGLGAGLGTALGAVALALLPRSDTPGAFLTDLGLVGTEWLAVPLIPICAGVIAFWTTRTAALVRLRETR